MTLAMVKVTASAIQTIRVIQFFTLPRVAFSQSIKRTMGVPVLPPMVVLMKNTHTPKPEKTRNLMKFAGVMVL